MDAGISCQDLAASFHTTLIAGIVQTVKEIAKTTGIGRVALSGGCFQNRLLLAGVLGSLEGARFDVLAHRRVPTNDGGIALGQAVAAGERTKTGVAPE